MDTPTIYTGDYTDMEVFRKNVLQKKLALILNAYHMGERLARAITPSEGFYDWLKCYAADYSKQFDTNKNDIMEVCDRICGNQQCSAKKLSARDHLNTEILNETCKYDFDILHALLQDNYPVNFDAVVPQYTAITGHDFPVHLSCNGK